MPGVVLGINLGHDRSACVAADGEVRIAIAEERLSRIKHDIPLNARGERYNMMPLRAIDYCLDACGIGYHEVDIVVASTTYVLEMATGKRRNLTVEDVVEQCPRLSGARIEILLHHLSHAASVAPCSGFASAAVLVVDGGGSILRDRAGVPVDFERTTVLHYRGGRLIPVKQVIGGPPCYGNSIGDFYQLITNFLGFRSGEEGKTMGLAGCDLTRGSGGADPADWDPIAAFRDAIDVKSDGWHEVSEVFQFTEEGDFHPELVELLGEPRQRATPDEPFDRKYSELV